MQQSQSQNVSTTPIGCIGWASFAVFAALSLYLLFQLWAIMGVVWGIGAFSVVLLLFFALRVQKDGHSLVYENVPVYFLLLILTCATIPLTDRPFINPLKDFESPLYIDWVRVLATGSLEDGDVLFGSTTSSIDSRRSLSDVFRDKLSFRGWTPPEWSSLKDNASSSEEFLRTYISVGGFGTATLALWYILLVGAMMINRSGRSALRTSLVLLAGVAVILGGLWAHRNLGLFAKLFTANDMLLLSSILVIVLSLIGFATTMNLTTGPWRPSDLIVCLSGLIWLTGISLVALTSHRSNMVLGIIAVTWLLLMLGVSRFHGTREWLSPLAKTATSRKKRDTRQEDTVSNERSKFWKEYEPVSDDESRQYQGDLDPLIDDQIEPKSSNANVPFSRGDIRIYRSYVLDLFRRFRIKEGRRGVLICNGRAMRVLHPGAYHVLAFPWFQKLELRIFDGTDRDLDVESSGAFTVFYESPFTGARIPLNVSMKIVVSHKTINPINLFQYKDPLHRIYDTAAAVMRSAVLQISYETFRGGEHIGETICTRLQENDTIISMGVAMLNVKVVTLDGDMRFDAATWAEDLALRNPDIQKFLNPGQYEILRKIEQEEGRDIASMIVEMARILKPSQVQAIFSEFLESRRTRSQHMPLPAPPVAAPVLPAEPQTTQERLQEEVALLTRQGVAAKLTDDSGQISVDALFFDADRAPVKVVLECLHNYPDQAPIMRIERGGRVEPFTSDALRNWATSSSLAMLVTAARQAFE